jgi:Fic family protein
MYSSISGTAAIEGNAITGEDVKKIAEGKEAPGYTKKDQQEIKNLIQAYKLLEKPFVLTEESIRALHAVITADIPHKNNLPGNYRNGAVYVGDTAHGGVYTPPKILDDVQNLMHVFVEWINIIEVSAFIRAILAHYYFCVIHPFWDGNGRTGRLIEAMILQSANIKYVPRELSNYYYRNVDEYYNSFSRSLKLKSDPTPFVKFCLEASVASLTSIKDKIIFSIRKFTLRDYYRFAKQNNLLTYRQFELLYLLLDNPISFSIRDLQETRPFSLLYGKITPQTTRRDLKKLVATKYLIPGEDGKYLLNYGVLG